MSELRSGGETGDSSDDQGREAGDKAQGARGERDGTPPAPLPHNRRPSRAASWTKESRINADGNVAQEGEEDASAPADNDQQAPSAEVAGAARPESRDAGQTGEGAAGPDDTADDDPQGAGEDPAPDEASAPANGQVDQDQAGEDQGGEDQGDQGEGEEGEEAQAAEDDPGDADEDPTPADGHADQAAPAEATTEDPDAEDPGISPEATAEQQDPAAEAPLPGTAPPGGKPGDARTGQPAQPETGRAGPDTPPGAGLKQELADLRDQMQAQVDEKLKEAEARYQASLDTLKADYEAGQEEIDTLRAEVKALRDDRPKALAGNTGGDSSQPRLNGRRLPMENRTQEEVKPEGDRLGLWSNAKTALYSAIGSTMTLAAIDQFAPQVPSSMVDIITGVVAITGLVVPVTREGWKKRKHDNSPDKL